MVGKIVTHKFHGGLFKVMSQVKGSRTKFICKDIDKGPGWDKDLRRYVGVNVPNGWYRGENYGYGDKVEYSKKYLTEVKDY